ncbi:MAG: hypothetical protein AB1482_12560 [Pseudomonadota bacterium]|jgi:hypothetical protein
MKAFSLHRIIRIGLLSWLTVVLGYFAVLALLIGLTNLISPLPSSSHMEHLVYSLLGLGGLLGLLGLWAAELRMEWFRTARLRRFIVILLLAGTASAITLVYFYLSQISILDWEVLAVVGVIILPVCWGVLLVIKAKSARANKADERGLS